MIKRLSYILLYGLLGLFTVQCARDLVEPLSYEVVNDKIVFTFTADDLDSLAQHPNSDLADFQELILKYLDENNKLPTKDLDGWDCVKIDSVTYQLSKSVGKLNGQMDYAQKLILLDLMQGLSDEPISDVRVAVSEGMPSSIEELENGLYRFKYSGIHRAVHLAGSFNNWSVDALPMIQDGTNWTVDLKLSPGEHRYKFVCDGEWKKDPLNEDELTNEHGTKNSRFVIPNYTMKLSGFESAEKVFLTGGFADWKADAVPMKFEKGAWIVDLYCSDGRHEYKFVVDGEWMLDPGNDKVQDDGAGNQNSLLEIGVPTKFELVVNEDYINCYLVGSFNHWNERSIKMKNTEKGCVASYVMPEGNYEYRYILDENWMVDPGNPFGVMNEFGEMNSWAVVGDTTWFELRGFDAAKSVVLSGSFNGWDESRFRMKNQDGVWRFPMHLEAGKHQYKFIVDGKWITDPSNSIVEDNFNGTGNSMVWVGFSEQ